MGEIDNKNIRLAKNTLVLYARMFLTVGISFYTTRVILHNLGDSDYGLYNLVAGVVSMLYIVTASISTAISRFLTYEQGKGSLTKQIKVFSTSINIEILFSLIVLIVGETIGIWFINSQLVIESEKNFSANIIYQLSLVSFIIELLGVPFYSLIVAHEKMHLFAVNAIIGVVLKLLTALLLVYSPIEKIIFYASGVLLTSIIMQLVYIIYSYRKFPECKYQFCYDRQLFIQMFSFGGWNLLTSASSLLRSQGLNIMFNIFYGTIVNAAFGVARQVEGTIRAFSKNFLTALYPQITKSYAEDSTRTCSLVYKGTKYSFILLFIIALPFMLVADTFMDIWLVKTPEYSVEFVRLIIILSLIEILLTPISYLNQATGNIKMYQIVTCCTQLIVLPIGYILLKAGCNPYYPLYTAIIAEILTLPVRVIINKNHGGISFSGFIQKVILKIVPVVCLPVSLGLLMKYVFKQSFATDATVVIVTLISIIASTFLFALDKSERNVFVKFLKKRIS